MTERNTKRIGGSAGKAVAALLALLCLFCLTPSARAATYEEALELYRSEYYVTPDAEQSKLLAAVDELYQPVLYAAVTGSSGISWFRANSDIAPETVARYWSMDQSALASAVLDMAKNEQTDSPEFLLAEQLFLLPEKVVGTLYLSTRGSGAFYIRDCIRLTLPRSDAELTAAGIVTAAAKLAAATEDLEQFNRSRRNLSSWAERMRYEESAYTAVNAWADYCGAIKERQNAAVKRYQDEVIAVREAAEAEKTAAQEREKRAVAAAEAALQEVADNMVYMPTVIPTDRNYTSEQQRLLNAVPRRYMPAVCFFFDKNGSLTPDSFFKSYTEEAYQEDAARLLKLTQNELEAEYVRLVELKNAGKATEQDANVLELATELLNVRYFRLGRDFLPVYITLAQDGTKGVGYDFDTSKFSYADFAGGADRVEAAEKRVREAAKYPTSAFYRDFFVLCRAFVAYKGYSAATAASTTVPDNYYILETCTGQGNGKGVKFFRIVYESGTGDDRTECTQYVFPTEDALANGYRSAQELGSQQERLDFLASLGYAPEALSDVTALETFHTDQFLFTADRKIESVKELQVFMSNGGSTSWTCYALRLYEVDAIAGLKRYGYYSSDPYINFDGSLIAQLLFGDEEAEAMTGSNHELTLDSTDVLFRFGENGRPGYRLAAYEPGTVRHYLEGGADNVILRVDFADQYGSGLECLATAWDGDKTLAGGGLCEAMTLRVRYRDTYGAVRQTYLPMITSAAGWAAIEGKLGGGADYAGLAQQGESIAFSCMLPEYKSLINVVPYFGSALACERAKLSATADGANTKGRDAAAAASETDEAGVTCIAVYSSRDAALSARLDGGFIRYSFPAVPDYVYRVREATGTRYNPGGTNPELTLTAVGSDVTVMNLKPQLEKEQYLITLVTDDVDMGGTVSDVTVNLGYQDVDGAEKETGVIAIREYVNDFYGYWPASVEDFGYRYGLSVTRQADGSTKGNSVSFLLPVRDVERFTGISLGVIGDDEWQVRNVLIHTVESVEPRSVQWTPGLNVSGGMSDRVIGREVAGALVFDLAANGTGASGGTLSPDGTPGRTFDPVLIQQGDAVRLDVESVNVYERQDVNWSELRFNMTYSDAMQDLGFMKARNTYTVEVLVGSDLSNLSGDDDCGSKNQFYFQLLFADGNASGVVLANQQLESDGFHSGATEAFTLTTSQDYGDVEAVRVIPEDTASDSDKYDKLMIEQITVKRNTNGELTPLWRVNDVGWIGIDYRDEGSTNSLSGVQGRTMEELSQVFPVSESSYAVNVQFSISTGNYVERGGAGNGAATPQFEGELEAWIYYRDTQGRVQRYHVADVVERMYAFNNRAASYSEVEANGVSASGKAVSDPNYMFRAGHTDRFEVSLDGLQRLLYVNFFAKSTVNCTWNVNDVEAWLVHGQGRRVLNVAGEYAMVYPAGQELELIGRADSQMVPKYYKQLYMGVAAGKSTPTMTVNFADAASVEIDDTVLESQTILRRVPATGSDTLNVVLYPGRSTASLAGYDLTATARYAYGGAIVDSSSRMNKREADGETTFYIEGLSVNGMSVLNNLAVIASTSASTESTGGFLQRVRGGFVLETYELGAMSNLEFGMSIPILSADSEQQKLTLQLAPETTAMRLSAEKTDIAVSFTYRADGPIDREYESPRIFLTDQGVNAVEPGQIVDLVFAQGHVKEITAVSVFTVGPVNAPVQGGYVTTLYSTDEGAAQKGRYSFTAANGVTASGMTRMSVVPEGDAESVEPLLLRFATGSGENNRGGGAGGAVSVSVGYKDAYGDSRVLYIDDVRAYLTGGEKSFDADSTREARIMASGVSEVRWLEVTPKDEPGSGTTIWNLQSVGARLGDGGHELTCAITESLLGGTTYHYHLANIQVGASVEYQAAAVDEETGEAKTATVTKELTSGSMDVLLASGEALRVTPKLTGSDEGVNVSVFSRDTGNNSIGGVDFKDTRGYTSAVIEQRAADAATPEEAAIWQAVQPDVGSWAKQGETYVLTPPRNFTGGSMGYRITITSLEDDAASVTVDVTVSNENDPVARQIADLRAKQQLEAQREIQKKQEELQSQIDSMNSLGGGTSEE